MEKIEGSSGKMRSRHFVLVHGACHGAWCWYKVIAELKEAGHKVTAIDLGASGINPKQVSDVHSLLDYSEPLLTFMDSLPTTDYEDDKVILVGHSQGGYSLCIAMERFPQKISVGVFAAAAMLGSDLTYQVISQKSAEFMSSDYMDTKLIYGNGPDKPPTAVLLGPKFMEKTFYRNSPRQDLELALTLIRPIPTFDEEQAEKDTVVTKDKYGTVPRAFVVCDDEKAGEFQWWQINNNPPDEHIVIQGSDHMVMFSKPAPFSSYLLQLGAKYF